MYMYEYTFFLGEFHQLISSDLDNSFFIIKSRHQSVFGAGVDVWIYLNIYNKMYNIIPIYII